MRKTFLFLALSLLAPLLGSAPVAGQSQGAERRDEARGGFSLSVHTHSTPGTLFPTDRLEIPYREGDRFAYSAIPCSRRAPVNDVALEFNPDYPGIDDPAPVRHLIEGTVTETSGDGKHGTIEGTLTTVLCVNGEEADRIVFAYEGRFVRVSDNELRVTGTYDVVSGTGRFQDLEGHGSIKGVLTCLSFMLDRLGAESCEDVGAFTDAVFRLKGTYSDPTVPTG